MGYLTTFTIYNDDLESIKKNPKDFTKAVYEAACQIKKPRYCGIAGAQIIPQSPRHSSDLTLYVHEGNHVYEPSLYNDEYLEWLKRSPKHHLDVIKQIKSKLSEIEKFCKEGRN